MVTIAVPFIVAIAFHIYSNINDRVRQSRAAFVSGLDKQLELYSGLWSRLYISQLIFTQFVKMEGFNYPEEYSSLKEAIDTSQNSPLARRYRQVMRDLWSPSQFESVDIFINNFSVLRETEDSFPSVVNEYLTFVMNYKILFGRWDIGDFSIQFPDLKYPHDILEFLENRLE